MKKVKYSKSRIIAQTQTKSLKYMKPMDAGTVLTIDNLVEKVYPGEEGRQDTIADFLVCKDVNGSIVKVPVKEFVGMTVNGGGDHYTQESGEDSIELPTSITVVSSKDRKSGEDTMYPIHSYNDVDAFLKNEIDYTALVASGLSDDNNFSPIQDYTVELAH